MRCTILSYCNPCLGAVVTPACKILGLDSAFRDNQIAKVNLVAKSRICFPSITPAQKSAPKLKMMSVSVSRPTVLSASNARIGRSRTTPVTARSTTVKLHGHVRPGFALSDLMLTVCSSCRLCVPLRTRKRYTFSRRLRSLLVVQASIQKALQAT